MAKKASNDGFTLIELSIAIIIISLLVAGLADAYSQYQHFKRVETTRDNIAAIDEAIKVYAQKNGHLPCVAPTNATQDTPAFGLSVDCAAPPAGVISTPGTLGQPVIIGAVPTRTLNIPDAVAMDGWRKRLTMAVSSSLATTIDSYDMSPGAISVVDTNGNSLSTPPGIAAYVVLSHGDDGAGASTLNAGPVNPCATGTMDAENCNNDAVFRQTTLYSEANNASHYDDYTKYQFKQFLRTAAITRYVMDKMECNPPAFVPPANPDWVSPNPMGERCVTAMAYADQLVFPHNPRMGVKLYGREIVAESTGEIIIKATIPVRYLIQAQTGSFWEAAFLVAIYVNGTEISRGDIYNPFGQPTPGGSNGGTGVAMGKIDHVVEGQPYNIEIFAYSLYATAIPATMANNATPVLIGSIKVADHSVDGMVEIMESGL